LQPDLLVVAAYGQILSREVLAVAKQGGINVHASLLPKYRGAAPIAWAIYHGEKRTGVTIIRMSVGLDAGDILAQEAVDILPDETAGELETRLGPLGAKLALESVNRMAAGPVPGMPQEKSLVTKAPKLTKEMGLIDWTKEAVQVCNQIRAMQPWPTAYTFLHSAGQTPMRIIICRAGLAAAFDAEFKPGQAVAVGTRLLIAAKSPGLLSIDELQPAGKRRMTAADFLRGKPIAPGDHFGPEQS
ncbi:MAG TPA: methionyl-tRNA formyltransferase, partial [Gemmataceae bacterium]|nr:methionyl-tRNA formyltransferase [Gemmataceae bacterium]